MRPFDLLQPTTVDEAVALGAEHGDNARFIAGGAMLMILLRQRVVEPRYVISLTEIPALDGLHANGAGLRLGATATLRSIERAPEVHQQYTVLAEAVRLVGNVRVRNVATLGGHLAQADIHMDLPPVLIALDGRVDVRGPNGARQVPLGELFVGYYETTLGPGELITSIMLPAPSPDLHGVYLKYCSLSPNDWPTVGVAVFLRPRDGRVAEARVVVGSVSDTPLRLPDAEALLVSDGLRTATLAEVARQYAAAADPLPDVRGSADYKRRMTDVFVQRALQQAAARAGLNFDV